jgi:hypothetical protein
MATKTTPKKRAAGKTQKPRKAPAGDRGNMKPGEIQALAITARQAFDFQMELGNLDAGTKFDAWRRDQVMEAVGKSGLSKCNHGDFLPVRAHFALLAGKDEKALNDLMRTGQVKDHGAPEDTYETRRQRVHTIREKIGFHVILAESREEEVSPKQMNAWRCIQADPKGPIREGYAIFVAKRKFKIQPRSIDELSDRLTVAQLDQLLFTIVNRIASKEGRPEVTGRNKSQDKNRRAEMRTRALGDLGPVPRA